jgi:hypothetical protein
MCRSASPPVALSLIDHVLVCVSVLPSVGLTLMAPVWRGISCSRALAAQLRPALIAYARVFVSALLGLSLAMMEPVWRDIGCFGGRVLIGFTPCHRYRDRSCACVHIDAAQLGLYSGGASFVCRPLLAGYG